MEPPTKLPCPIPQQQGSSASHLPPWRRQPPDSAHPVIYTISDGANPNLHAKPPRKSLSNVNA